MNIHRDQGPGGGRIGSRVARGLTLAALLTTLASSILFARLYAPRLLAPAIIAERRAELALAWPILVGRASLIRWRSLGAPVADSEWPRIDDADTPAFAA